MASVHIANFVDMTFMFNINAGVGKNRANHRLDVMLVQWLLRSAQNVVVQGPVTMNSAIYPPKYVRSVIAIDGICGQETLDYIAHYQMFRNSNRQHSGGNKMEINVKVATDGAVDPWRYPAALQSMRSTNDPAPLSASSTLVALCYDAAKNASLQRFEMMPPELQRILLAH